MYAWNKIKNEISANINEIIGSAAVGEKDLSYPPNSEFGDLSLALFSLSKSLGKSPQEIGALVAEKVKGEIVAESKITGPYLNFFLNKKYLAQSVLSEIEKQKNSYGAGQELKGKKIMVEFAHPNPFKSFHIGHLRNILVGESIVRLLEARGAKIIRTNYQGDVGMHIAKCLWAFQKIDEKDYPTSTDERVSLLGKCYAEGAKAFEGAPEDQEQIKDINKKIYSGKDKKIKALWNLGKKWSLEKFHEIYARVYSRFDREYMESEVIEDCLKYVKIAKNKKILEDSEGAVVFKGEPYGLDTRVFLNSDGLPTYEGKELGLAYREFSDFGQIDLCIHNVAVEQKSFFAVTFKVEELLDEKKFKGKQHHNAYEFVGLKKGKMSSRLGNVILGNDILDEAKENIEKIISEKNNSLSGDEVEKIAVAAVKYAFLKINAFKYLSFDLEESVNFSGNSGPYLLYTYARINSIFKKDNGETKTEKIDYSKIEKDEAALILQLARFPETAKKAADSYDPSEIAKYLFDLAKLFNDYYHKIPVLKAEEETKKARLVLLKAVAQVIKNGLELLGIKTVEEM